MKHPDLTVTFILTILLAGFLHSPASEPPEGTSPHPQKSLLFNLQYGWSQMGLSDQRLIGPETLVLGLGIRYPLNI